jgi:uncharacterized protein YecE (DUF72 family)
MSPHQNPQWDRWLYRIGCPVWGCRTWHDQVYPNGTQSDAFLAWYSSMFPTVEGNSTFYAVPPQETFKKWRDSSCESFQFSFKFPRRISHDLKLSHCDDELKQWLERLEILRDGGRLGPTFLQLSPSFSFRYLAQLSSFLRKLPRDWPWAVEVRHLDWFDEGDMESTLDDLLQSLGMDRVLFDSSPLNSLEAADAHEEASQKRKPKSPYRTTITGKRPMLRLIGRNNPAEVSLHWEQWARTIASWIRDGYEPWIFTHAPDDTFAPSLARLLHDQVRTHLPELLELPKLEEHKSMKQLRLFD